MASTTASKLFRRFTNLFRRKQPTPFMQNLSQEHLDKLLDREKFLRTMIASVNKKMNHANWVMRIDFGAPATLKARDQLLEELAVVCMQIDFLVGFLKE